MSRPPKPTSPDPAPAARKPRRGKSRSGKSGPSMRQRLDAAKAEIERLRGEAQDAIDSITEQSERACAFEKTIAKQQSEIERLRRFITNLDAERRTAEAEVGELSRAIIQMAIDGVRSHVAAMQAAQSRSPMTAGANGCCDVAIEFPRELMERDRA